MCSNLMRLNHLNCKLVIKFQIELVKLFLLNQIKLLLYFSQYLLVKEFELIFLIKLFKSNLEI